MARQGCKTTKLRVGKLWFSVDTMVGPWWARTDVVEGCQQFFRWAWVSYPLSTVYHTERFAVLRPMPGGLLAAAWVTKDRDETVPAPANSDYVKNYGPRSHERGHWRIGQLIVTGGNESEILKQLARVYIGMPVKRANMSKEEFLSFSAEQVRVQEMSYMVSQASLWNRVAQIADMKF